jgi:sugar/nucleoside kinase (ribokinase family)
MNKNIDVYFYGMTLLSAIHRLEGPYPAADGYQEIGVSHELPAGETGNGAILLSKLGLKVKADGTFLGVKTRGPILRFNREFAVDCSGMRTDKTFEGWRDLVLVDGRHRTVFGNFSRLLGPLGGKKWTRPDEDAIKASRMAAIDPFFGADSERAARLCRKAGTPFVTLDCAPDSALHRFSVANVVSNGYLKGKYKTPDLRRIMEKYTRHSEGMTVFTFGRRLVWYARRGWPIRRFAPFSVKVSGTVGAGDAFRAGLVYGLLRQWDDLKCIRFAAALAACVCRDFPAALHPPSLKSVLEMMKR